MSHVLSEAPGRSPPGHPEKPHARTAFDKDTRKGVAQLMLTRLHQRVTAVPPLLTRAALAVGLAVYAMLAAAGTALAQQGGGGGQIEGAIQSAVDWFSGIMVSVGTLGILVAAAFWIASGPNERRREKATAWLGACAAAVAIGFLAPAIVGLIETWTGGASGGG